MSKQYSMADEVLEKESYVDNEVSVKDQSEWMILGAPCIWKRSKRSNRILKRE